MPPLPLHLLALEDLEAHHLARDGLEPCDIQPDLGQQRGQGGPGRCLSLEPNQDGAGDGFWVWCGMGWVGGCPLHGWDHSLNHGVLCRQPAPHTAPRRRHLRPPELPNVTFLTVRVVLGDSGTGHPEGGLASGRCSTCSVRRSVEMGSRACDQRGRTRSALAQDGLGLEVPSSAGSQHGDPQDSLEGHRVEIQGRQQELQTERREQVGRQTQARGPSSRGRSSGSPRCLARAQEVLQLVEEMEACTSRR